MNANIRTIGGSIGTAVMASIVTSNAACGRAAARLGLTNGFWFLAACIEPPR